MCGFEKVKNIYRTSESEQFFLKPVTDLYSEYIENVKSNVVGPC